MAKSLPPKPNLEQLKKQAKALLKAHKHGDVSVCETLQLLHRFSKSTSKDIFESTVSLKEVQFAIALSYGFKGWEQLARHVESLESGGEGIEKQAIKLQNKEDQPMSNESLMITFMKRLDTDEDFRQRIQEAAGTEARMAIAKAEGFEFPEENTKMVYIDASEFKEGHMVLGIRGEHMYVIRKKG